MIELVGELKNTSLAVSNLFDFIFFCDSCDEVNMVWCNAKMLQCHRL